MHASVSSLTLTLSFSLPLCLRWIWYTVVLDFFFSSRRRPTEYNFPFLLSRPLSRAKTAQSEASLERVVRPRAESQSRIYISSPRAIRYTFLGRFRRQLGTMRRAVKRNERYVARYDTVCRSVLPMEITIKI